MKFLVTLITFLTLSFVSSDFVQAQESDKTEMPEQLSKLREKIVQEEKESLKIEVEKINTRLDNGTISAPEAEVLKKAAAEKHALNIENRIAIANNQVELESRNQEDTIKKKKFRIVFGMGEDDEDDYLSGVKIESSDEKSRRYDRRTTSGLVFAFGLNNVITDGESLEDSDFKIAGSRFTELGWTWNTRVFKNSNWLRVKYGFSFQFNGLKPTDNRFYVDTGEETELQAFPHDLKKSKFRIDNFVIPVMFEFGPSKKIEHENYFRYTTRRQFKMGVGAYGGFKMSSRQKLKYTDEGENRKEKLIADYNTNNFIYGVNGYIGFGSTSLYVKYDLNTIFKNNPVDQRNISLGLRFDFD